MITEQHPDDRVTEKAGSAIGLDRMQVKGDAQRFKKFIEQRGVETGGWRGHVDRPEDELTSLEVAGGARAAGHRRVSPPVRWPAALRSR